MAHDDPFFPFCKAKFAILAVKGNFKAGYYHTKMLLVFQAEPEKLMVGEDYHSSRAPRKSFMLRKATTFKGNHYSRAQRVQGEILQSEIDWSA